MKIGDIDIRRFRAKQLTVDVEPPQTQVAVEMFDGALIPSETKTYTPLANITVGVLFRGESRNEIIKHASAFNAALQKGKLLTLDGYERKFMAYLQSNTLSKTKSKKRYLAEFKFTGYWKSDEIAHHFERMNEIEFNVRGNKDAPCIISIIALQGMSELTINGFDDEITISNIERGKNIIINGEQGIITEDGKNKFNDCELWEYPYLKTDNDNEALQKIIFSNNQIIVDISYSPLWI